MANDRVWPFSGRERHFEAICAVLLKGGRSVVVSGAPGVGKTRLAVECLRFAEEHGFATAKATATGSAAGLPFGALAPLLPVGSNNTGGGVDRAVDLLRRYATALVEQAGDRPLLLLVDDAHLLDPASATLIHQLAARKMVTVLVTVRNQQAGVIPDAVTALWKDDLAELFELEGLDVKAVQGLLASYLDGRVSGGTAVRFVLHSGGNALFLRELVIGALDDGCLSNINGIWQLTAPLHPSTRLNQLIESRLAGLGSAERQLLEVVAFGEPLGTAELEKLGDPTLAESLERKQFLTSQVSGRRLEVRLAHPLFGEVLRTGVPALRAQTIMRSLAEVVEESGCRRRDDTLRVAVWRLDAGGASPQLLLEAATTARWHYDFALAERLAQAAHDSGAGFEAALFLAQLASRQGRIAEAEESFVKLGADADNDDQLGAVTVNRLDNSLFSLGRMDEGIRIAAEADQRLSDPLWRDEIAARRTSMLVGMEGYRACMEASRPLLKTASISGRAHVWLSITATYSLTRLGRFNEAFETAETGHNTHLALTEPLDWDPCMHVLLRCDALAQAGRFAEAEKLATQHYQDALRNQNTEAQAFFAWHLGKMTPERGHVQAADSYEREAVALFRQLGGPLEVQGGLVQLALTEALNGKAEDAKHSLEDSDALGLSAKLLHFAVDLLSARAWTAAAEGDLPAAQEKFEEATALGEDIGDLVGASAALHALARIGNVADVASRLSVIARDIEGELAPARVRHVEALQDSDPEKLEQVSQVFEAMGATLLAAEAAADTGVVWRRRGNSRRAAFAYNRARALRSHCPGVVTPALQSIESRVQLTAAERKVAMLAAKGRSNNEIAQHLYVSVRTVENQLQRVYHKLGISRRSQIVECFDMFADGAELSLD